MEQLSVITKIRNWVARIFTLSILCIAISSCGFTQWGDFFRETLQTKSAQAYDEGLVNAEFLMCRASSVGSVMRRYWTSPQKIQAWLILCYPGLFAPPTLTLKQLDSAQNDIE